MNLPNVLTLVRMPLTFAIVALMYGTWPGAATLAFWLFIAAAITDWLDGKLARERNIVSDFGKFMDALADKVLVLGVHDGAARPRVSPAARRDRDAAGAAWWSRANS